MRSLIETGDSGEVEKWRAVVLDPFREIEVEMQLQAAGFFADGSLHGEPFAVWWSKHREKLYGRVAFHRRVIREFVERLRRGPGQAQAE